MSFELTVAQKTIQHEQLQREIHQAEMVTGIDEFEKNMRRLGVQATAMGYDEDIPISKGEEDVSIDEKNISYVKKGFFFVGGNEI